MSDLSYALRPGYTLDSLIRQSKARPGDAGESDMSETDQRDANTYVMKVRGATLGREFVAINQSGHSVIDSKAWQAALARCASGASQGIVIAYSDRLARNWRKLGGYLLAMEEAGAEVIIAGMPGVDYRTANGSAMVGMMAVASEMLWQAAKSRGDRIADGTLKRGVPNRVGYGYRRNQPEGGVKTDPGRDRKALVPDEGTAHHVAIIFKLRADGYSWPQMAEELATRGIPAARGGEWTHSSLRNLLHNRQYLGEVSLGDRPVVRDAHRPLVTVAQWNAAHDQRGPTITRTGRLTGGLALGLLRCGTCGGPMSVTNGPWKPGRIERRTNYSCRLGTSKGRCERPMYVSRDAVDAWLDEWVVQGLAGAQPFDVVSAARAVTVAAGVLADAEAALERVVLNTASFKPEHAAAAYAAAVATVDDARLAHARAITHAGDLDAFPVTVTAWRAASVDGRRRALASVIAHITVSAFDPSHRHIAPAKRALHVADRLTLIERGDA